MLHSNEIQSCFACGSWRKQIRRCCAVRPTVLLSFAWQDPVLCAAMACFLRRSIIQWAVHSFLLAITICNELKLISEVWTLLLSGVFLVWYSIAFLGSWKQKTELLSRKLISFILGNASHRMSNARMFHSAFWVSITFYRSTRQLWQCCSRNLLGQLITYFKCVCSLPVKEEWLRWTVIFFGINYLQSWI